MKKILLLTLLLLVSCAVNVEPTYKEPKPTIQQEYHLECINGIIWEVNYDNTLRRILYDSNGETKSCDPKYKNPDDDPDNWHQC